MRLLLPKIFENAYYNILSTTSHYFNKVEEYGLKTRITKNWDFLNDAVIDYINQYCDNEIVRAKEKQREKDISSAVCAFVELKRTDSEIYQLLNKHFCVENISEAQDYIKNARIHIQIINLRIYCTEHGMTLAEFRQYAKDHTLEKSLNQLQNYEKCHQKS